MGMTEITAELAALILAIGNVREKAMQLCWQIEKCGASEDLTKASLMASELVDKLNELLP